MDLAAFENGRHLPARRAIGNALGMLLGCVVLDALDDTGMVAVRKLAAGEDDLDPFGGEVVLDLAAMLHAAARQSAEVLNQDDVKVAMGPFTLKDYFDIRTRAGVRSADAAELKGFVAAGMDHAFLLRVVM